MSKEYGVWYFGFNSCGQGGEVIKHIYNHVIVVMCYCIICFAAVFETKKDNQKNTGNIPYFIKLLTPYTYDVNTMMFYRQLILWLLTVTCSIVYRCDIAHQASCSNKHTHSHTFLL